MKPLILTLSLVLVINATAYTYSQDYDVEINVLEDFEAGSRAANRGDHKHALIMFEQCAKKEDARCYFALGTYYYFGDGGIEQDFEKAYEYLKKGSDGNYGPSEYLVAIMLRDGVGVEKDNDKALEYLESSAYKCIPQAQEEFANFFLGMDEINGLLNAYLWFSLSAENGSVSAGEALTEVFKEAPEDFITEALRLKSLVEKELKCQS
jgi:hypothetical protein